MATQRNHNSIAMNHKRSFTRLTVNFFTKGSNTMVLVTVVKMTTQTLGRCGLEEDKNAQTVSKKINNVSLNLDTKGGGQEDG